MSIIVQPYHKSPTLSIDEENATWDSTYSILGTNDEAAAINALIGYAPLTRFLYDRLLSSRTFSLDPENYNVWRGKVSWKEKSTENQPLERGESSFQFETTAGTAHVTHSLATIQKYKAGGGTPADFKQAVNYNGAEISGADIYTPTYSFSETHVFAPTVVTQSYKAQLFRLTGKTNQSAFRNFAAGEVLFLGASGSKRGDDEWEISYRFACSENKTALTVGNISGISKKGWELLWVYFKDAVSEDILVKQPDQVNIERMYDDGDFFQLGIGS
jgi:hypothetical protein